MISTDPRKICQKGSPKWRWNLKSCFKLTKKSNTKHWIYSKNIVCFWHWVRDCNFHQTLRFWKPLRTWAPCHPLEDLRIWRIKSPPAICCLQSRFTAPCNMVSCKLDVHFVGEPCRIFAHIKWILQEKLVELGWFEHLNSQTTAFGLENAHPPLMKQQTQKLLNMSGRKLGLSKTSFLDSRALAS